MSLRFGSVASPGLPFCPTCNTLLLCRRTGDMNCATCGYKCNAGDLHFDEVVQQSEDQPAQRWLGSEAQDRSVRRKENPEVEEECPKCGHGKASFYTMQLRSADEGQTVFYECLKCAYKWKENN